MTAPTLTSSTRSTSSWLMAFGPRHFDDGQVGREFGFERLVGEIAVDRRGDFVAGGNRLDDERRARRRVAGREHAGAGGREGVRVDGDGGLPRDAHARVVGAE